MTKRRWGVTAAVAVIAALAPLADAGARTEGDDFAAAQPLAVPSTVTGDTTGNTFESGEAGACGNQGATTWFRLEVPKAAVVSLDTDGSGFDTILAVYRGPFDDVACNDNDDDAAASLLFEAAPGVDYWVQLGGKAHEAGPFTLTASYREPPYAPPPPHDDVGAAVDASEGYDGRVATVGATAAPDEPPSCDNATTTSVWYRVAVPVRSEVLVHTWSYVMSIDAYEQRPDGSLALRGCAVSARTAAGWGQEGSVVRAVADPSAPLLIRVAAGPRGSSGDLLIAPLHLPRFAHPHDRPETAGTIGALPAERQTDTYFASSVDEPGDCSFSGATVWYRYQPLAPTPVVAHTTGSYYDTVLAVYRQDGDVLTEVACNDDGPRGLLEESLVRFVALPGETYLFKAGGYDGATGHLELKVEGLW